MIEQQTIDGREATIAYMDMDWNPVGKDDAELVKIVFDDGEMLFLTTRDSLAEDKQWNESDHPRDKTGEFSEVAGGGSTEHHLTPNKLAMKVPGFAKIVQYLDDDELSKLKGANTKKLMDMFAHTPPTEEFAAAAYAGRAKKGWYEQSAHALIDIFGLEDAPRFVALLAATSPQTSVQDNATNALNIWVNWDQAGRPKDRAAIKAVMGRSVQGEKGEESVLGAWLNNTVSALTSEDPSQLRLSGPKVDSFAHNLRGAMNKVTNDTWMANFNQWPQNWFRKTGPTPGYGPGYLANTIAVRKAAELLSKQTGETWTPANVQETVWSWARALASRDTRGSGKHKTNEEMQQLLKIGGLTAEQVNDTPDFYKLFIEGAYRKILERGGYGERVAALASGAETHGAPGAKGDPGSAKGSGFTQSAFERHLQHAAKRLSHIPHNNPGDDAALDDWEESKHPREEHGRFATVASGGAGGAGGEHHNTREWWREGTEQPGKEQEHAGDNLGLSPAHANILQWLGGSRGKAPRPRFADHALRDANAKVLGRHIKWFRSKVEDGFFPNLDPSSYHAVDTGTFTYNCIGFAMGDHCAWWPQGVFANGPTYWPAGVRDDQTTEAFDDLLVNKLGGEETTNTELEPGFIKFALYALNDGTPTHLARQAPDGKWLSKLGSNYLIEHDTPEQLTGDDSPDADSYGAIAKYYKVPIEKWERADYDAWRADNGE